MKKLILLLSTSILFLFLTNYGISQINCDIEIASEVVDVNGSDINPGDVVCLLAGNKDFLRLIDIQGTEAQPITIINKDGPVVINTDHFYGVKFDNCKHVIFSGTGDNGTVYGIQIKRVGGGAGMSVDNMSTNIEIENVEISYTLIGGIYAKTEPYQGDCDDLITRDKFTMYDLKIHDCYLHDIADEGFYIGSSKYTGQTIYECDDIVVLPHIIEGVEIYNNIVENTGWDGIQVSSAPVDCKIYNNIIRYDSYEEEPYQMSGILIGGGAKCDCYNNQIYDGKGDGIDIFGLGDMKIFNNLIVRAGRTFKPDDENLFKHGIYIGELVTDPGATFKLYNNTIISPKSSGIKYANNDATMGYIKNNLITDPGQLQYNPNSAYLNISSDPQKVEISNNYNAPDNSTPKFVNYNSNDFDLKPDSPAVNYGTSLTNEGIIFDIEDRFRPFHTYFDAGAYECHDPYAAINENDELIGIPYPIPAKDYICVPVNSQLKNIKAVSILSLEGKIIYTDAFLNSSINNNELIISLNQVKTGKYILNLTFDKHSINRPIIVVK